MDKTDLTENIKVAVVCAFNPNNAGMYSVDKAAKQVFADLGVNHRFFVAQAAPFQVVRAIPRRGARLLAKAFGSFIHPSEVRFGEIKFSVLKSPDQFKPYSHVLFWGDFLNNPVYGIQDFAKKDVEFHHSTDSTNGFKRWQSLFVNGPLMAGKKVGAIGGNFQYREEAMPCQGDQILRDVANGFDLVVPRDPYSLQTLRRRAKNPDKASMGPGMDCAFLLQPKIAVDKNESFSFHFGRSRFTGVESFVDELSQQTGLDSIELKNWFNLRPESASKDFLELEANILSSRFVVTDTYHVSVNALRLGVPVFCLGRAAETQKGTLGDFKKRALFEMFHCNNFYFAHESNVVEDVFMHRCVEEISKRFQRQNMNSESVHQKIAETATSMHKSLRRFLGV